MKRGITPLIASVLLISFVIILAAIILIWGTQSTTELVGETESTIDDTLTYLEGVKIEIHEFTAPRKIDVENIGNLDIVGLIARGYTPDHIYVASSFADPKTVNIPEEIIKPFEIKKVTLNFNEFANTGEGWLDLTKVEIIPFVETEEGPKDVILKKESATLTTLNFCDGADINDDKKLDNFDMYLSVPSFYYCLTSSSPENPIPIGCEPFDFNNGIIDRTDAEPFLTSDIGYFFSCLGIEVGSANDPGYCDYQDYNGDGFVYATDFTYLNECLDDYPMDLECVPHDYYIDELDPETGSPDPNTPRISDFKRFCETDCFPNGVCEYYWGESSTNCPSDCICGNGLCDTGEDETTCPTDC